MALFDPSSVNKQIDAFLSTVPPGKKVILLGQASLREKKGSAALVVRVTDNIGAYARVTKTVGQELEVDGGFKITFLLEDHDDSFTYSELVEVLKARGKGWIRAHIDAYKILNGQVVEL
jgi:hypothetical protein